MEWSLCALIFGFIIDLFLGDPHSIPHPVAGIGRLITFLDKTLRRIFPKTVRGENIAGGVLWLIVVSVSTAVPFLLLWLCYSVSPWFGLLLESIMCWQILALKSLRDESMKVYSALKTGDTEKARYAVSMIVGRDTKQLDDAGIARAAVETVAENTSDGVIAPLLFLAIGGTPLGFFYKAVNTMDSMLGYTEPPYKNIGLIPAKADDILNFIPARISALFMLVAGWFIRLDIKNGWRIFRRDRFNHASPNSAQTESVCAGLMGLRLAGDATYHGVIHKKPYIGDEKRPVCCEDIRLAGKLLYVTAAIAFVLLVGIKLLVLLIWR